MTRHLIILFLWTSINSFAQAKLTKDSFFVDNSKFPKDYKTIVGDPKGWRVLGRFNCHYDKLEKINYSWDTLYKYTPFRQGNMFSKIRGNKIIGKGDKRAVTKIIYVDNNTLIVEDKSTEKINGKNRKVKIRTRYRRVT